MREEHRRRVLGEWLKTRAGKRRIQGKLNPPGAQRGAADRGEYCKAARARYRGEHRQAAGAADKDSKVHA